VADHHTTTYRVRRGRRLLYCRPLGHHWWYMGTHLLTERCLRCGELHPAYKPKKPVRHDP